MAPSGGSKLAPPPLIRSPGFRKKQNLLSWHSSSCYFHELLQRLFLTSLTSSCYLFEPIVSHYKFLVIFLSITFDIQPSMAKTCHFFQIRVIPKKDQILAARIPEFSKFCAPILMSQHCYRNNPILMSQQCHNVTISQHPSEERTPPSLNLLVVNLS